MVLWLMVLWLLPLMPAVALWNLRALSPWRPSDLSIPMGHAIGQELERELEEAGRSS